MAKFFTPKAYLYADPDLFRRSADQLFALAKASKPLVIEKTVLNRILDEPSFNHGNRVTQALADKILVAHDFEDSVIPHLVPEAWESGLTRDQVKLINHVQRMDRRYGTDHSRTIITDSGRVAKAAEKNKVKFTMAGSLLADHAKKDLAMLAVKALAARDGTLPIQREDASPTSETSSVASVRPPPSWRSNAGWLLLGVSLPVISYYAYQFRTLILGAWPIWGILLVVMLAIGFFTLRCKRRFYYGVIEVGFGIYCVSMAVLKFDPDSPDTTILLQIVASMYIIVRGFDNLDQAKPRPDLLNPWWGKWFTKPEK